MRIFNTLFYIVLFVGFFLPTNTNYYLPLGGALVYIREFAFLMLPIINVFCLSRNSVRLRNKKVKNLILFFFAAVFLAEIFKIVGLGESAGGSFKSLRIGLPLFSSLILVYQGIRADITKVWHVLLSAITVSCLLSFLSMLIPLPIYSQVQDDVNSLMSNSGRLVNANAAFGIIGLYLLFEDKDKWYNQGKLVRIACILSLISLILAFNRTYLALLFITFAYLAYKNFNRRKAIQIILMPVLALVVFFGAYKVFPSVQHQVDKRIFSIVFGETSITESTIEGNRDFIYNGIEKRINQGYWVFGLPYGTGIFEYYQIDRGMVSASKTDISLINILLIDGILALFLFIFFLWKLWKIKYLPGVLLIIFILASLNTDELYNHNSIFFILLFGLIYSNFSKINLNRQRRKVLLNKTPIISR